MSWSAVFGSVWVGLVIYLCLWVMLLFARSVARIDC